MTHEAASKNTKTMFAASLKNIVSKKPFSKVTVSELIADCGVNRKTFYYHFADVYDLLKWTLEQEAIDVVKNFDLLAEYEEAILFVMDYVEKNNAFLRNIHDSLGREELKHFFYLDFRGIVESIIRSAEEKSGRPLADDYREFLTQFCTEALAGILLDWIISWQKKDRQKTVRYISETMYYVVHAALTERFQIQGGIS